MINQLREEFVKIVQECSKFLKNCRKFLKELSFVKIVQKYNEFLKELSYLWLSALTAVLSLIFFTAIDQTLDVYRVLALNPYSLLFQIFLSFFLIFFLSFSIWYSGRNLYRKDKKDKKDKSVQLKRIDLTEWLPRIFGFFPLLALGLGLFRAMNITNIVASIAFVFFFSVFAFGLSSSQSRSLLPCLTLFPLTLLAVGTILAVVLIPISNNDNFLAHFTKDLPDKFYLSLFIAIVFSLSTLYFWLVINRRNLEGRNWSLWIKDLVSCRWLFKETALVRLSFLSILIFSIFTFPLITNEVWWVRPIVIIIIVIIAFLFLLSLISYYMLRKTPQQPENSGSQWFFSIISSSNIDKKKEICCWLFFSAVILSLTAFWPPFNFFTSWIGSVSIIALFLMLFVLWSSQLFYLGRNRTTQIPIITIFLILAILSSWFDSNDNHQLRESLVKSDQPFPELNEAFNEWLMADQRKNEISKATDDHKYPIYIISAQGGGIKTAYHAGLTLSRLQDLYPDFANHVFAISGVSGGSLGSSVFSSLVGADSHSGQLETKADKVLAHDLLSPLLAAGLFPDFVQRFIPLPLNFLDRARGLEYAFEQAWDQEVDKDKNPLRSSFYQHWKPKGTAPALVLNTTVVETGERLVLSPFKIDLPDLKDIRTVACKSEKDKKDIDFPLSTAAVLSARFTLVTPVAWFYRCVSDKNGNKSQKARLADGGYFENSGVSTAYEIGSKLQKILTDDNKNGKIKVVYLAFTNQPSDEIPEAGGFNEVMSPISALYNSREAVGHSVIVRVKDIINKENFRQFYLQDSDFKLPLGWFLSKKSQNVIKCQIGYYKKGEGDPFTKDNNCQKALSSKNNDVFKSISEELNSKS